MEQPAVCRTCLSRTTCKYRSLFKESLICGEKRKYTDLLALFVPDLQILETDNLPTTICSKCSLTLKHFIRFRKKCMEADFQLTTQPKLCLKKDTVNLTIQPGRFNECDVEDNVDTFEVEISKSQENQQNAAESVESMMSKDNFFQENKPNTTEQIEEQIVDKLIALTTDNSKHQIECQYCHKVLSTTKSYQCHLQLHSDEANYLCNCCGERFKTKMAHTGHMATHNPEKYRCDICGKSYRQAASLRSHKLNHSQDKPFICTICGHSTTQKSGLKKHLLTHSESKSYVCDLCGEHFRFSSNLIMHKRRKHSIEKNYVCSDCPKGFVSKDELLNHSMCHTDERPFGCDMCGKLFNRKSSLQFHQKHKHSIAAKISCHVCGKCFAKNVSLQNHLRTHIITD